MYGPSDQPQPIEKIRKAQWTVENTRATQAVVDTLIGHRNAMRRLQESPSTIDALTAAIKRFTELDPKVKGL